MSIVNIKNFYQYLEKHPAIQKEALALQEKYPEQEQCIEAFLQLAAREGFNFTLEEFIRFMYLNAKTQTDRKA